MNKLSNKKTTNHQSSLKGLSMQRLLLLAITLVLISCTDPQNIKLIQYELVIAGGRVIDPESGFDQTTNVAINNGKIAAISKLPLAGIETIDASGLVVSPGFIDIHSHALSKIGHQFQAMDGVTTALELEAGVYPIDALSQILGGKSVINYGASVSHLAIRQLVMDYIRQPHLLSPAVSVPQELRSDTASERPHRSHAAFVQVASEQERNAIQEHLEQGIAGGGLGIGFLFDYLSEAVSAYELDIIFEVASAANVPVFTHIRRGLPGDPAGLEEIISLAKKHQTSVHICHLNSSAMGGVQSFLDLIAKARADGLDITTEAYPYNAGSTGISAAVFGRDWQSIFGITYQDIEWAATGERFTQSMWNDYRKRFPDGQVIHHYGNEEWTRTALQASGVIVASDAMPLASANQRVHPRGIGTFSKMLGHYTASGDRAATIDLITALAKMTVLPAKRMEEFAPAFRLKGRLRQGFDADLTLFDPIEIMGMASYKEPLSPSKGIQYVLVNGEFVLRDGELVEGALPGRLIKGAGGTTP